MLDNFGEMCKPKFLFDSSDYNLNPLSENPKVHMEDSALFGEVGSVFSELEEEVMMLQLLLEEPKCSDIVDTVLDINTSSNAQKNFYVNEHLDSAYLKADDEVLHSSFTEGSKTVEQFLDGLSEENCDMVPCEENSHFDACEDYLLDITCDERAQNLHSVLNKEIYMDDKKFDYQSVDLDGRSCGSEVLNLSSTGQIQNSSPCHSIKKRTWLLPNFNLPGDPHNDQNLKIQLQITGAPQRSAGSSATKIFKSSLALSSSSSIYSYVPRLEARSVQNSLLGDDMSSDKLRQVFQKLFGCQTTITDEQWLRHHILLGLQNSDKWKKNLTIKEFSMQNENKGVEVSSATEDLLRASSPFSSVFNFKRKRRVQRVKKKGSASCESFKYLCFALERNSECNGRKSEITKKHSKDNILHDASERQLCREGSTVSLQAGDKQFQGCTEIPLYLPVEDMTTRNEGREWMDHSSKRQEDSYSNVCGNSPVESQEDSDTYSVESEDDTSENEWKTERIKQHRKNHFWSLTEVINLVEGVSKYGVGRWIYIKRLFFRSSAHRTPADLKDKWRNLLSASCGRSQKRRVRPRQKRILQSIPQHILCRIRDLAAMHPYPRKKVKQTTASADSSNTAPRM